MYLHHDRRAANPKMKAVGGTLIASYHSLTTPVTHSILAATLHHFCNLADSGPKARCSRIGLTSVRVDFHRTVFQGFI